jgi:hypothetical protein
MGCSKLTPTGVCGRPPVGVFLTGPSCANHTPAAVAGRVDHIPDPELTLEGVRAKAGRLYSYVANDSELLNARARAKGQRASGAQRRASHAG